MGITIQSLRIHSNPQVKKPEKYHKSKNSSLGLGRIEVHRGHAVGFNLSD